MVTMKICGFAILCVMLILLLRQQRSEYALLVGLAGGIMLIGYALSAYLPVLKYMTDLMNESALAPYAETLFKAIGVGFVVQTSAELCRDTGENSMATKLELAGKAEVLIICLPLIKEIVDLARGAISG
ncbi:MAG: stage III sporulation protein AD [Clostridiales bacterium]|nr:stage III sporulation protein AD [Clostridiales bacterium]